MSTISTQINDLCNKYKSPICISAHISEIIIKNQGHESSEKLEIYRLLSILFGARMDNVQKECPYILHYRLNDEKINLKQLSELLLQQISEIADSINDPLARGRLTDILWINKYKSNKKPHEWAKNTIEDYISLSISNNENWYIWGKDELERAIILCKLINDNERLNIITSKISDEIIQSTTNHYCLPIQLLDLMAKNKLLINDNVLKKIETLAMGFGELGNYHTQQQFYHSLADFYKQTNDDKFVEYKKLHGLTVYNYGNKILDAEKPNFLQAFVIFGHAYQIFREIPNNFRTLLDIQYLMNESQKKQRECLISSRKDAKTFTTTVDVSQYIEETHQFIKKLDFNEDPFGSLEKLFWKTQPASYETLFHKASQSMKDCLIMQIGQTFITTQDGRLTKSISPNGNMGDDDNDDRIYYMMFMHYNIYISFVTYLTLYPFLDIIRNNSLITENYIEKIVDRSPFILPEKRKIWIRGLLAGLQGDFMAALFILSPLVEDFVRTILKYYHNVDTIYTSPDGVQTEKGLSTLINEPMLEIAIDKDLVYELNVLFCGNVGFNLRNNIAHGLVNDDLTESYISVYAWWFVFKLIFLSSNCILDRDD